MSTLERVTRISLWILSLFLLAVGFGIIPSYAANSPDTRERLIDKEIKTADSLFANRNIDENAIQALNIYKQLYETGNQTSNIAWRLSMANYFVGLRIEKNADAKKDHFRNGRLIARRAIKFDKDCVACHFWAGVNTALYGESIGTLGSVFLLQDVREHLQSVLDLDPSYAQGGAYRILAIIKEKLPGALGGSNQEAEEYFQKAIEQAPKEPMNYLFLTKLLLKSQPDRSREAAELVLLALSQPVPDAGQVESLEARKELEALIEIDRLAKFKAIQLQASRNE